MKIRKREIKVEAASFKDPNGFIFCKNNTVFRQINLSYKKDYNLLVKSGLYRKLVKDEILLPHIKVNKYLYNNNSYLTLQPKKLNFISYPYEWSFNQLKDAALLTLKLQKISLHHNMSLKDASAYNIQFIKGKPIFIDLLSFESYRDNTPWIAYKQFCQHFLAPLLLESKVDLRLGALLRENIDGIPLDLTSRLLPKKTWLNISVFLNIHLHAMNQKRYSYQDENNKSRHEQLKKEKLINIIDNLEGTIKTLKLKGLKTQWSHYYSKTNYSSKAQQTKMKVLKDYVAITRPKYIWDLGANTGVFSRIGAKKALEVISFDMDPLAVDINYQSIKKEKIKNILPLILDLTNPSPAIGWGNKERKNLVERKQADMVTSLALIHHLAISNNLPLKNIADYFSRITNKFLVIEYIDKNDSHVKNMLKNREDIFDNYTKRNFENSFKYFFKILKTNRINDERTLYLLKKLSTVK